MALINLEDSFVIRDVTPQQCFDYITDPACAHEWNTFIKSATRDGDLQVGAKIVAKIQFLIPLPFEVKSTVTASEPPTDYKVTSKFPFTAHLGARIAEHADGSDFTFFLDMEPTKFFPVPKMVLRKALKSQFDRDKKLLQQRLQALAG